MEEKVKKRCEPSQLHYSSKKQQEEKANSVFPFLFLFFSFFFEILLVVFSLEIEVYIAKGTSILKLLGTETEELMLLWIWVTYYCWSTRTTRSLYFLSFCFRIDAMKKTQKNDPSVFSLNDSSKNQGIP